MARTFATDQRAGQRRPNPQRPGQQRPARKPANRRRDSGVTLMQRIGGFGQGVAFTLRAIFSKIFMAQSQLFVQLVLVTAAMLGAGLIMVLSSSAVDSILKNDGNAFATFGKQVLFALFGVIALSVASLFSPAFYQRHALKIFSGIGVLQVLIIFFGVSVNGNRAWLDIGFTRIQPSEFLKIGLIFALAYFIEERQHLVDDLNYYRNFLLAPSLAVIGIVTWITKDVGTALVMVLIVLTLVWLSGVSNKAMLLPLGVVAIAGIGAMNAAESRMGRIKAFFDPASDVTGLYTDQTVHAIWGISAGRIVGVGLGQSKMKWTWIPEVENDFIFAVISEELGMIGALVVIGLFVYLGILLKRVALRTDSVFNRMLVFGIGIWLIGQAIINIAVVLNMFPVLGVPLPLISAGGSSLISGLAAIGVVLAIERDNYALETGMRKPRRGNE